jgi:hypothetical protein
VGEWFRVVGQVPLDGGGQVGCLGLQELEPFAVVDAAQGLVGLLGQPPVVVGVTSADLGEVGPRLEGFGDIAADGVQHP